MRLTFSFVKLVSNLEKSAVLNLTLETPNLPCLVGVVLVDSDLVCVLDFVTFCVALSVFGASLLSKTYTIAPSRLSTAEL